MRSRGRFFLVTVAAVLLLAAPVDVAAQKAFSLDDIVPPGDADPLVLTVSTSGTPLPVAELQTAGNWRLGMVTDDGTVVITPLTPAWDPGTKTLTLSFPRS